MRPTQFEYVRAADLDHALSALSEAGEDARPIAGGQSLMPMMNLRLAQPSCLVDISRLGLDEIVRDDELLRVGALVRHERYLHDPIVAEQFPVLRTGVASIGHPTIRRHGTTGGSIAHADPTAELPLLALLHDAQIVAASIDGERRIAAADFFLGAYETALEPGEIVIGIELSIPQRAYSGGFAEIAERRGDFAIVACGVLLEHDDGRIARAAVAVSGGSDVPLRVAAVEQALIGRSLDGAMPDAAIAAFADTLDPPGNHSASSEYRRALTVELMHRAIADACLNRGGSGA